MASPPGRGTQDTQHPVSLSPAVVWELPIPETAGLVDENDFNHDKPALPDIKVSQLEPAYFVLPDFKIFLDKSLPDPHPTFLERLTPNENYSPEYFTALHQLVSAPGSEYPGGTYNFKGTRISLAHTTLNIPSWKQHLAEYHRQDLIGYLEYGFPIGVDPDGHTEPCLKNHSSSFMFYTYLDKFCMKEITKAGLTGPFGSIPFPQYHLSPMMTSVKRPSSRRCVFDASYGSSLNKITPQDYYLENLAQYDFPKLDDLEEMILKVGPNALMWKRDLSRYFLQLPLDPVDYWRTGFIWRQNYFFFTSYMFGQRHAGWAGQAITSSVTWIHRRSGLDYDGEEFNSLNYSDDLAGCEDGERAMVSYQKMGCLLEELGLEEAASKASPPSTEMEYLGVLFNSVELKKSVPPHKLAELRDLLFTWQKKKTCTKRCLQSLTGKLLWVARCVRHSRCFISRLLSGLKTLAEQHHKLTISEDMRLDILWWYTYIREFNGVGFIINPSSVSHSYAGDACLLGGGGYHGAQYWSRSFPLTMKGKPIHELEYWVLLISIRIWGPSWTGTTVELFCDNTAVVDVCNMQKPSNPEMAKFLREFLLLVVKYKFVPIVKKISTSDNWIADFVSRSFDYSEHQAFFVANNLPAMTPIDIPDYEFLFSASW